MNQTGYDNLRNGIVLQACKDYRSALAGSRVNGRPPDWIINEVENFFHSRWFEMLTGADPDYILERIRKEFGDEGR